LSYKETDADLAVSMTLNIGDATVHITNNADPALLSQVIRILQGISC
jgi:hypothetical protein